LSTFVLNTKTVFIRGNLVASRNLPFHISMPNPIDTGPVDTLDINLNIEFWRFDSILEKMMIPRYINYNHTINIKKEESS